MISCACEEPFSHSNQQFHNNPMCDQSLFFFFTRQEELENCWRMVKNKRLLTFLHSSSSNRFQLTLLDDPSSSSIFEHRFAFRTIARHLRLLIFYAPFRVRGKLCPACTAMQRYIGLMVLDDV